jgi:hypothetical protein
LGSDGLAMDSTIRLLEFVLSRVQFFKNQTNVLNPLLRKEENSKHYPRIGISAFGVAVGDDTHCTLQAAGGVENSIMGEKMYFSRRGGPV